MNLYQKVFSSVLLLIMSSTISVAENVTYIIHNDHSWNGGSIDVDYTICTDRLENNSKCSEHKRLVLFPNDAEKITLNSSQDVMYIWTASIRDGDRVLHGSDYSKVVTGADNIVKNISNCFSNGGEFITLNSFGTNKMACQIQVAGKQIAAS